MARQLLPVDRRKIVFGLDLQLADRRGALDLSGSTLDMAGRLRSAPCPTISDPCGSSLSPFSTELESGPSPPSGAPTNRRRMSNTSGQGWRKPLQWPQNGLPRCRGLSQPDPECPGRRPMRQWNASRPRKWPGTCSPSRYSLSRILPVRKVCILTHQAGQAGLQTLTGPCPRARFSPNRPQATLWRAPVASGRLTKSLARP